MAEPTVGRDRAPDDGSDGPRAAARRTWLRAAFLFGALAGWRAIACVEAMLSHSQDPGWGPVDFVFLLLGLPGLVIGFVLGLLLDATLGMTEGAGGVIMVLGVLGSGALYAGAVGLLLGLSRASEVRVAPSRAGEVLPDAVARRRAWTFGSAVLGAIVGLLAAMTAHGAAAAGAEGLPLAAPGRVLLVLGAPAYATMVALSEALSPTLAGALGTALTASAWGLVVWFLLRPRGSVGPADAASRD